MESKEFEGFEILEKENIDQDVARIKVDQEYQQREQKLLEDAGKTKNDLGKGEKKKGGGLFSSITSVFGRGKKKDKKQKKDDIYNIGVELEELDGGLLEEDEVGDELNNVLKNYKEEDDADKAEKNMEEAEDKKKSDEKLSDDKKSIEKKSGEKNSDGKKPDDKNLDEKNLDEKNSDEIKDNDSEKNTGDEIEEVGVGLDDILKNFKTGDNKAENDQQNIGNELEALHDELDEDEEDEEEEPDEYVYDSKLHWGTTNLLHSFLYHKGEKYKFSEHGKVRNWFHKKLFGNYSSQAKAQKALDAAKKAQSENEKKSGRFYGDDVAYKRWEHTGVRNSLHDTWYHMKNAHRKAVDRFYNYEQDYRKMPAHKRFFWCVKNPLARIMVNFPRTRFGTQARAGLLDRMRKLYRQAISEGAIPRSDLGDLDYDPLTGSGGYMTKNSELKQIEADQKNIKVISTEDKLENLKIGRSALMKQLMLMNRQTDLLAMRCVSEGVDPNVGILLFMKDKVVRNAYVKHLNALKKTDWEIAKAKAEKEGQKLPDESGNPDNNPFQPGDSDEDSKLLLQKVYQQMGIPLQPIDVRTHSEQQLQEGITKTNYGELGATLSLSNYYIATAVKAIGQSKLPSAAGVGMVVGVGMPLFLMSGITDLGMNLEEVAEGNKSGDKQAVKKNTIEFIRNTSSLYSAIAGSMSTVTGPAWLAYPGTVAYGLADIYAGGTGRKALDKMKKEIEVLKKEEQDKKSRKYKMIDMAGDVIDADKSGKAFQLVSGVLNTVGGVFMFTGALSSVGTLLSGLSFAIVAPMGAASAASKKHESGVRSVNVEMNLVERQKLLWDYYLKKGGQPSEYSRGITKRAILMEEGFEKGTRKQAIYQQKISYAQKITDNLNSDNPDPAYLKLVKAMRIDKGRDNMYHMEVILKYLGMDTKNVARDFLESTSDNEFKDAAARLSKRNELIKSELKNSLGKGRTLVGEDIVERARRLKQSSRPVKEKDIKKQPVKKQEEMIEMDDLNEKKEEE